MEKKEGYVVVADTGLREVLFGMPSKLDKHKPENIETNGLVPYGSLKDAKYASENLGISCFKSIGLAKLSLEIAESEKELNLLKDSTELVVIMNGSEEYFKSRRFFGPSILGNERASPSGSLPGTPLSNNGYLPYKKNKGEKRTPFQRAMHLLEEVCRQAQCPGTIAKFKLERL